MSDLCTHALVGNAFMGQWSEGSLHTQLVTSEELSAKHMTENSQNAAACEGPKECGFVKATT